MYMGTPLFNLLSNKAELTNIDKKHEKQWMQTKMFILPLWAYVFEMLATHIYCLILFSTNFQSSHWLFANKPESTFSYLVFGFVISFFGSLASTAGHELVHNKEWYNKVIGNLSYTQFLYSHFWDEHTKGHHKNIATPLDPVCHDMGVDVYTALTSAVIGTHISTWDREVERLQTLHKSVSAFTILTQNRMIHYFLLHVAIVWTIY